ncbi:hypothetical protein MKX01_022483 [Papaver californicum]|nr:hypothetical protein MKX01_022483 [Papaver californicum]
MGSSSSSSMVSKQQTLNALMNSMDLLHLFQNNTSSNVIRRGNELMGVRGFHVSTPLQIKSSPTGKMVPN